MYVGGGDAGWDSANNCVVMAYDIASGKWATLPQYTTSGFAMTAINTGLVLVGGEKRIGSGNNGVSNILGVFRADDKEWTHPFPGMEAARYLCSVVVFDEWLVVAGGKTVGGHILSSVEILHINSKQWYAGPPAPTPWYSMKTALVGDTCYFIGGNMNRTATNKVYSLSLASLVTRPKSDIWMEVQTELQTARSTPLSISGSLLVVGGWVRNKATAEILLYQPDTRNWINIGELPAPRSNCTCALMAEKTILVAGGFDGNATLKRTDIAQIACMS